MNVALIGATGFVGSQVLKELIARGHQVVAIARNPDKIDATGDLVTPVAANVLDPLEVTAAVTGTDAVVATYNPGWTNPNIYNEFLEGAQAIQQGVKDSGVTRFLLVGGAGSLEVAPGLQLVDTPEFPAEYKAGSEANRDYLNILRKETELDWTYLSPAIEMHPGTSSYKYGTYKTSLETPVFNEQGRSIIAVEDLAKAVVDEIENPQYIQKRFTVGY
ncbi:NAD(P)-dependent oxidoreductase [Dyadobacter sp. CY323]|uniref:NAD(P)-dependent oxidoreductase n=1 Tax=Dyadobacter sp. CY323 TaxID=2907302 RepID=UPI001F3DE6DC|nr:NAD(P)H-binding protein [Dyadobacter sp. CY323]MCE6993158.1 NAD(P)H-binding protein [Dyadobacter sp. CY323]